MKKQFKQDVSGLWSFFPSPEGSFHSRILFLSLFLFQFFSACSEDTFEPGSDLENQAIIDQVNLYVNSGECAKAIELIEPLYHSEHSNDSVRVARASAHLCRSGLSSYFDFLNNVIENPLCSGSNCNAIWTTPTGYFTLSGGLTDANTLLFTQRKESALYAIDALQAVFEEGVVVPETYKINAGSYNIGSLRVEDRTDEANLFIFTAAMSAIGAIHNLFGQTSALPFTSNYYKRVELPWTDYADMDSDGCDYSSAVMNLIDVSEELTDILDTGVSSDIFSTLDTACATYCTVTCGFTAAECGTECSIKLRNRDSCLSDEIAQCHAAALVDFINTEANYGWPCEAGGC